MLQTMTEQQVVAMHAQLFLNHQDFYQAHIVEFFEEIRRIQLLCNRSIFDRLVNDKLRHPIQTFRHQKRRLYVTP
jgi:hypothetical protein